MVNLKCYTKNHYHMHVYGWDRFTNQDAMKKSQVVYWQLVWFFSMEESAQGALLGTTQKPWFVEENKDNFGANYLIGLCFALSEGDRPFSPLADELRAAVLAA